MDITTITSVLVLTLFISVIFCVTFYRNIKDFSEVNEKKPLVIPDHLSYASIDEPYLRPFIMPNVLSKIQCNTLINYAMGQLEKTIVDGRYVQNKYSKQVWILKDNPLVKDIIEFFAKKLYVSVDNAENVQMFRYLPYQTFEEKYDSCCDDNGKCKDFLKRGGQRKFAIIIYLNQDYEGGETYFRNLDLKYKPNEGGAIVLYPLADKSSKCHPYSVHNSLPISRNDKWTMQIWFREYKIPELIKN